MPEGHTWSDFRALPEEDLLSVVEIDCVEDARTDTAVLLTMLFKRISFLLVFVLEEHTQECVRQVFDSLEALLGERFRSVFPLLLTDCGHEFQDHEGIELRRTHPALLLRARPGRPEGLDRELPPDTAADPPERELDRWAHGT